MKQYYFFAVALERNNSGQNRTVLYPLTNQTTYFNRQVREHPVNPDYRVQVNLAENSKVVRLRPLTVIGVCHEGFNAKECRLPEYSRNDVKFYRTNAEVFMVCDPESSDPHNGQVLRVPNLRVADNEMMDAYRSSTATDWPQNDAAAHGGEASRENVRTGSPAATATTSTAQALPALTIDPRELERIENYLRDNMDERNALLKLLVISQIRDRMRLGVCKFVFRKQNGEVRTAYGTRNSAAMQVAGANLSSSENRAAQSDGAHFCYFDAQKRGWRSFCVEDIMSVCTDVLITSLDDVRALGEAA